MQFLQIFVPQHDSSWGDSNTPLQILHFMNSCTMSKKTHWPSNSSSRALQLVVALLERAG